MIIGINVLFAAQGGSLTNLRQLLSEWKRSGELANHQVIIYCSRRAYDAIGEPLRSDVRCEILEDADRGLLSRMRVEQLTLPRLLKRDRVDVLFSPGNTMPLLASPPCVTTFQNAAPFCESVTPRSVGFANWVRLVVIGIFMRLAAWRSARVIFISNFFHDLFVRRFRLSQKKGVVIYRARDGFL